MDLPETLPQPTAPVHIAPATISAAEILKMARDCGVDDCGLTSIGAPGLEGEQEHILRAFPAARTLPSLVRQTHREPIRSPARSVANLEFHGVGHELDDIARAVVLRLEDSGIPALNPAMAFPMEMDNFPERGWIVSHKRVAEAAGMGRMGIHRNLIPPRFGSFVLLGTVLIGAEVDETSSADAGDDLPPDRNRDARSRRGRRIQHHHLEGRYRSSQRVGRRVA